VVILTAVGDLEARVAGLSAGADDFFTKPVAFVELRTRLGALLRVRLLLSQLERAEAVITTLALTIEARDPYTLGHCDRLSRYAVAVGEALGLDREMVRSLRLGGYLHDLGKISVPDGILLKPGPLDPIEQERIRAHPGAGSDLVLGLRSMELVRPIMRHHHEKWDGSGYPDRLKGEAIPLGARIISVVDEAAKAIVRTSFSTLSNEANDFACVLTDARGFALAQNSGSIPSFIGTLPATVRHFLAGIGTQNMRPGDVLITNDPWQGTGHMSDVCLVKPIFHQKEGPGSQPILVAFAATTSHMPDIGGRIRAIEARELFEEGFHIPLTHLIRAGQVDETLLGLLLSQTPLEVRLQAGDNLLDRLGMGVSVVH